MKVRERLLRMICIISFIMMLLSAYIYMNGQVSYKYEVQDFLTTGTDPEKNLDVHQKEIISWIRQSKIAFIGSAVLLTVTLLVRAYKPTMRGKLEYI